MHRSQVIHKGHAGWRWVAALGGVAWLLVVWGQGIPTAAGASPNFPLPKVLEPNVAFWIKVFAEVDSRGGLLHDPEDLRIIYHTFSELPPDRGEREDIIEQFRSYYMGILATLAEGKRQGLTLEEQRIFALFAGKQHAGAFWEAAGRMRFQGGVSSRFADSIVRSWSYLPTMERIFAAEGVPLELTLLPHIESSFLNAAVSHVGAAGLWQFMPGTGRRFLTVSRDVDERLNVERATTAAARLLQENYDYLGTWPLAITAYNHGANGMQRAVDAMGTTDIEVIVQNYKGPAFGFASRNFYVEFLAAIEVATNYHRYFPHLAPYAPRSPSFATTPVVARQVQQPPSWGAQNKALPQLAARQNIMERQPYRMPKSTLPPQIIARQEIAERRVYQTARNEPAQRSTMAYDTIDRRPYLVQSGETLTQIATQHGTTVATLVALNDMPWPYAVQTGQLIVVPVTAAVPQSTLSQRVAETSPPQLLRPPTTAAAPSALMRPLRQDAEQALIQPQRLQMGSVVAPVQSPQMRTVVEPTPAQPEQPATPSVATPRYQVKRGETLAQIAARHDTTMAQLISLNKLRKPYTVTTGQQLVLPAAPAPVVAKALPTPSAPVQEAKGPLTPSAPVAASPETAPRYQVKRGETLAQIAARHDTTMAQLISLNKLRKPYTVTTGQQLVLPATPAPQADQKLAIAKATLTPPAQKAPEASSTQPESVASPPRYQVKRGETLAQIAARHDTTMAQLISLNKLRKPYTVTTGQQLVLPAAPAPVVAKATPAPSAPVQEAKGPLTPSAPVAASPETATRYEVKRGETLAQIAARHDTTMAQLISLNKLRKPYTVTTGQQLVLSAAPAAQPAPVPAVAKATLTALPPAESSRPYQVKRGETLAQIAARHQTTADTLIALNKLRKPYTVNAGQKLVVPSVVATPASKARPQSVVQKRYRVRQGDTLATIADRFETTTANIITVNDLRRPYTIKPGQVLLLPQPSPEAAMPNEGGKRLWRHAAVGDARQYATA